MKKLVFMFVAIAAISFASCGGNKTNTAAETDTVSVDTVTTDTTITDTAVVTTTTDTTVVSE